MGQMELLDHVTWCSTQMRTSDAQKKAESAPTHDQVIKPLVKSTAARYAAEKKLTARTPADCQS